MIIIKKLVSKIRNNKIAKVAVEKKNKRINYEKAEHEN